MPRALSALVTLLLALPLAAVPTLQVRARIDPAKGTYSPAMGFHGGIHEVAHFWWHLADVNREDWLNEGLAEFSALRMSAKQFGPERRKELLTQFLQDAAECSERISILGTNFRHDDRYVNLYEKTSLLLAVLEKRHGAAAMDAFLKEVYQSFKGTRAATTIAALVMAEKRFGRANRVFLEEALNAATFPLEAVRRELDLPAPKVRPNQG